MFYETRKLLLEGVMLQSIRYAAIAGINLLFMYALFYCFIALSNTWFTLINYSDEPVFGITYDTNEVLFISNPQSFIKWVNILEN